MGSDESDSEGPERKALWLRMDQMEKMLQTIINQGSKNPEYSQAAPEGVPYHEYGASLNWEFETPVPGIGLEEVSFEQVSGVPGLYETDPESGDCGPEYTPQYNYMDPGVPDVAQSFAIPGGGGEAMEETWRPILIIWSLTRFKKLLWLRQQKCIKHLSIVPH